MLSLRMRITFGWPRDVATTTALHSIVEYLCISPAVTHSPIH